MRDTEDDLPLSDEDMPDENLPLVEVEELEQRPIRIKLRQDERRRRVG